MTNTKSVRELISKMGLKYQFIAKELGLTPFTLQKKIDNVVEFKSSEISKICDILNIYDLGEKERLFFAQYVANNSTRNRGDDSNE